VDVKERTEFQAFGAGTFVASLTLASVAATEQGVRIKDQSSALLRTTPYDPCPLNSGMLYSSFLEM
jgi:hypothetical protein